MQTSCGPSWKTLHLDHPNVPHIFADTEWFGWQGNAALTNEGVKTSKVLDDFLLEGCLADGNGKGHGGESRPKGQNWFARLYNVTKSVVRWCVFRRVAHEHPLYFNAFGALLFEDLFFEQCESQGLQLAWRAWETFNAQLASTKGDQVFRRLRFERCGLKRGRRPAFALSLHGAQGSPRIEARAIFEDLTFLHRDGFACLLVENRPEVIVRGFEQVFDSTAGSGKPRGETVLIRDCDSTTFDAQGGEAIVRKGPGAIKFECLPGAKLYLGNFAPSSNVPVMLNGKTLDIARNFSSMTEIPT